MKILKTSTKKGRYMYDAHKRTIGTKLSDVYSSWSSAKQSAYEDCEQRYYNDKNHIPFTFRITSKNAWAFIIAWDTFYDGFPAMIVETSTNTYCIIDDTVL